MNPDSDQESESTLFVIRVKKVHGAFVGFGVVCFIGGFFAHSLLTTPSADAVVRTDSPASDGPSRVAVNSGDDPFIGPSDAPVVVVEFSDFECPFCQRFRDQTLDRLLATYEGKIRFVYRDYPIASIHPNAQKAAETAECAHEQGLFWEMHDKLFASQSDWSSASDAVEAFRTYAAELSLDVDQFDNCLASGTYAAEVRDDYAEGQSYGVRGTPAFFVNGRSVAGAVPFSMFQAIIEEELAASDS